MDRNGIELLTFEANEYILRPGDKDDAMYVVLDGQLAVYISVSIFFNCFLYCFNKFLVARRQRMFG